MIIETSSLMQYAPTRAVYERRGYEVVARVLGGTHLRRDTVILQWFQASKAVAASDGHAVHC